MHILRKMPVPPEESLPALQSVVIITSHPHLDWAQLVKGILESAHLSPCSNTEHLNYSVQYSTPWKLVNKYYAADVQLSVVTDQWPQQLSSIKDQAEALIVYWDNTQKECLAKLNTILDQLDDFKPEVCLLVCDGFSKQPKLSRYESTQWCVAQGWELVELLPPEEDDSDSDDLEDDFKESCGYHRIRGALHANCWTSMTYHQTAGKEGSTVGSAPCNGRQNLLPGSSDPFVGAPAPPRCLLISEDEDDFDPTPQQELDESFDDLFARFENLRVTAASLPREDRLDYAERVAMAFLQSMGEQDDPDEATGNADDNAAAEPGDSPDVQNDITARDAVPDVDEGGAADDFCGPSYDAIEQEFVDEQNEIAAAVLKEKEDILNEFEQFADHNKKIKM